ncbi:PadR family transcriptional regulator [Streptomyces sp. NBC_00829]|uniref:PadR family transcriptional regulator n=1 Tax=Streptomyces sp. NBC_00829 TaxID=2903679 RepID=UPI00386FAB54|nr:PadR family transcriptional regulator [Streptomyces sp. NBC_00829]
MVDASADWQTGWLRGALELALAAVLAEGAGHGYALAQRLAEQGFGRVRGGALYPVLGRMERDGVVSATWEPGEGGPGRKVYALTEAGRDTLREQRAQWARFSVLMGGLLGTDLIEEEDE